jgi:hypothetical protein
MPKNKTKDLTKRKGNELSKCKTISCNAPLKEHNRSVELFDL